MLIREKFLKQLKDQLRVHKVCGVLGPRQCGKSTLAHQYAQQVEGPVHTFDLENPEDLAILENPMRALEQLTGLVVIDEIQRRPDLFAPLRVLADQKKAKFLILGSASRDLIQQSSETLAGRIGYIELTPLGVSEGGDPQTLLLRGGFPESYLSATDEDSALWRKSYIRTFLERDIPALGFKVPPLMLQRFWMMLSHYHGQIFNGEPLAKSLGVSGHTVRSYLDILAGTFMVRILQPWIENTTKRQVKSPKIYLRDSGLMNTLSRIEGMDDLNHHPLKGAIWEGFALEEILRHLMLTSEEVFFWRTAAGAELDLLVFRNGKKYGFEFKYGDAPKITKSMHIGIQDLHLEHLYVIYPGQKVVPLASNMTGIGLNALMEPNPFFLL